ncbi:MAG: hypothetical protein Q3997_02840 [Propionibacteriaceae bacterium]|nr:hypothetical protein [Propionibacteriaceae bacterium]
MILPVSGDETCARMAAWLPGLADHSLTPQRSATVSAHVDSCERCRAEVEQLREVRALLGARGDAQAPSGLSGRLLLIAGEDASQPLWLSGGATGALPSRRKRRARIARRFALSSTVAVLAVLSLALLMAPALPQVTDPADQARRSFSRSMTALGLDGLVVAVLAASDAGVDLRTEAGLQPSAPLLGPAQPLAADQAAELLSQLRDPGGWLAGTQRVSLRDGGVYRVADVTMAEAADGTVAVSVLDAAGKQAMTGAFGHVQSRIDDELLAKARLYSYPPDGTLIAGREVAMLEARAGRGVLARWWFTTDAHLLRSERYGADGSLTLATGYTQLAESVPGFTMVTSVASAVPVPRRKRGDCVQSGDCRERLAGLPLVHYSSSGTADAPRKEFVYSDGVTVLCVTRQKGWLAPEGVPVEHYLRRGTPLVWSWQSGSEVVTIATNGSGGIAQLAHDELPSQAAAKPDLGWRIGAGLRRLAGLGEE